MTSKISFLQIAPDIQALLDEKLEDAPADSSVYGRKDNTWVVVEATGGVLSIAPGSHISVDNTNSQIPIISFVLGTDEYFVSLVEKQSIGNIDSHITNFSNPHSVTKEQVGLGLVDNTPDIDKPVSYPQQQALNNKIDANPTIYSGTATKISFDAKGLVIHGEQATQDDIEPGSQYGRLSINQINTLTSGSDCDIHTHDDKYSRTNTLHFLYNFGSYVHISPISVSTAYPHSATLPSFSTYLVEYSQAVYISATNDASNYWKIELIDAGSKTVLETFTTASLPPQAGHVFSSAITPILLTQSTNKYLYTKLTKIGSPSDIGIHTPAAVYVVSL